jgi:hypothetical protein
MAIPREIFLRCPSSSPPSSAVRTDTDRTHACRVNARGCVRPSSPALVVVVARARGGVCGNMSNRKTFRIHSSDQSQPGTNASNDLHICIHAHGTTPTPVRHDASTRTNAPMCVPTRSVFVCTHKRPIVTKSPHPAFSRRTFRGAW